MEQVSRRAFVASTIGGFGFAWSQPSPHAAISGEEARRPNIVFLLADDLRRDGLGCMGNSIVHTPSLDAMAAEGVVFDNAYVTTSICAPSRATILSGQYVCRHGINDFARTFTEDAFAQTYPALLRGAGYATGFVGKFGVGEHMPAEEFDYWRGYAGQGEYEQTDEMGNYKHLTRIQEEDALEFIRQYAGKQPFCLSVSFKAPHCQDGDPRQFIFDPDDAGLYKDTVIPCPDNLRDTYNDRFPEFFRKENEARNRWKIRFSSPALFQEMVKSYYRLITGIDRAVGAIRQELISLGIDKDTILVFTSDNGFFLGEHGLAGKWYGYEASIRVPLLIFDPRLPEELRGTRRSSMALNADIAPTLLGFAGIRPAPLMQGKNLMPVLHDDTGPWRTDFFYEHTFEHPAIPKSEGVVSREYKYLRYIDQNPVYEELFDLRTDPDENDNLAANPDHRESLEHMRIRYKEIKQEVCAF